MEKIVHRNDVPEISKPRRTKGVIVLDITLMVVAILTALAVLNDNLNKTHQIEKLQEENLDLEAELVGRDRLIVNLEELVDKDEITMAAQAKEIDHLHDKLNVRDAGDTTANSLRFLASRMMAVKNT